ncbi:DUF1828 domain-containing protein [Dolosigranulum pigrum]|uniref:DUF1828 domain-containing protein n=1 Tax=Dolosigranulum pigrum TaxID=29394 RepID=A0A516GKX5_9LACT|nr:DUF1828 domain-containing protein [Dolosigranulum pigrum]QDO92171.1 DUF1828 domain-containing protein [Dolosigranulum pigrum]QDO92236.1 DUF1828 domain-containing protein [Dolosigranulum pigrum]QDO92301.1 DUF1828 domain-containing protein [Dolosigranulum pigrum]
MNDEIIEITELRNMDPRFTAYELLTNRLDHIGGHITLYKIVNDQGKFNLTDCGWTLQALKMYGIGISGRVADRIDELLADHHVYRGIQDSTLFTKLCSEDEFSDEVTNFLDVIESIYKEFLG